MPTSAQAPVSKSNISVPNQSSDATRHVPVSTVPSASSQSVVEVDLPALVLETVDSCSLLICTLSAIEPKWQQIEAILTLLTRPPMSTAHADTGYIALHFDSESSCRAALTQLLSSPVAFEAALSTSKQAQWMPAQHGLWVRFVLLSDPPAAQHASRTAAAAEEQRRRQRARDRAQTLATANQDQRPITAAEPVEKKRKSSSMPSHVVCVRSIVNYAPAAF
jgi:hypothetical protein